MRKLSVLAAFLVLVVAQGCNSDKSGAKGDGVSLKFNLQKGKSYVYSMKTEMETEAQSQKMENEMAFDYSMQVLDDKDSLKTIRTIFDRIQFEMKAGKMDLEVDTNEPQKDSVVDLQKNPMGIMSNMFYALKGKSFDMKINEKGEVVSVTGINEMMNAMMNSLPGDEATKQGMAMAFQSQFNEESIKKMFAQSFSIFPDKPVKEGDTWNKTMSMGGMAAETKTTYKVKEINGDHVLLDVTSDISANGATGKQTGTMKVDAATGLVLDANLEQKLSSPMVMTSKTKITGKEK